MSAAWEQDRPEADSRSVNCQRPPSSCRRRLRTVRNERRLSERRPFPHGRRLRIDMRVALIATASFDYCVEYAEMLSELLRGSVLRAGKKPCRKSFRRPESRGRASRLAASSVAFQSRSGCEAARPDQGLAAGYRSFSWREQHLAQSSAAAFGADAHRDHGSRHRTSSWGHRIASGAPAVH